MPPHPYIHYHQHSAKTMDKRGSSIFFLFYFRLETSSLFPLPLFLLQVPSGLPVNSQLPLQLASLPPQKQTKKFFSFVPSLSHVYVFFGFLTCVSMFSFSSAAATSLFLPPPSSTSSISPLCHPTPTASIQLLQPKLYGLVTFDAVPLSDSSKIHYFQRLRHAPIDIFDESKQIAYSPTSNHHCSLKVPSPTILVVCQSHSSFSVPFFLCQISTPKHTIDGCRLGRGKT